MGIEKFFNTLKRSNLANDIIKTIINLNEIDNEIHNYNHLLFDFNSIIYNAMYYKIPDTVDTLINNTIEYFENTILKYISANNLEIFIDGIPTMAKIIEQRKRRYLSYYVYLFKKKHNILNNKLDWLKVQITIGTVFMDKLIKELKLKYYVSDDNGEAEKKIVNHIVNDDLTDKIAIWSPDADMILMSLLVYSKTKKDIYILRYNQQTNVIDEISITKLAKNIIEYVNRPCINPKYIINDIVFIYTIFGNDFLPKIFTYAVELFQEDLIKHYKKLLDESLDNIIILENNIINNQALYRYFYILKKDEYLNAQIIYLYQKCKDPEIKKYIKTNINKVIKCLKYKKRKKRYTDELDKLYALEGHYKKMFKKMPYNLVKYKLKNKKIKIIKLNYYKLFFDMNYNTDISCQYIIGLKWLIDYYYNYDIKYSDWYYKYNHAPLMTDLSNFINTIDLNTIKIDWSDKFINLNKYLELVIPPFDDLSFIKNIEVQNNILKNKNKKINIDCRGAQFLSKCFINLN